MSNQSPFGGRTAQAFPTLPKGDVLGTYDSYPDAQRVVAKLAEADFPVNQLSIVGNDLKTVERVTGKMTYGRAALAGALSGLWLGIFFGIVLTLFSPSAGGLILAAAIIGAAFGMLYGIVSFAITKRQRDFTSVHQVLATNYQIVVDPQLTGQARRI
ncbi:MAG: general stress protein, partial [Curtobacterium sp.]